jgi:DNA polymerase-3 subunit gamma/tau
VPQVARVPQAQTTPARAGGERLRVVEMAPVQVHAEAAPALPAAPVPSADVADMADTADMPELVEVSVRDQPEPGTRQQPNPSHGVARLVPTDEGELWHQTVTQLAAAEAITALTRELALQSQLIARDGDHWMLRVERESLNMPSSREKLRAALAQAGLGARLSVEVGVVVDSPARRNAALAAEKQRQAEELVRGDAFVQAMVRDFGAKIVASGIKPL